MRFLPAVLIACSLFVASACSGASSNTETASLIHRVFQAATSNASGQLESFPGKLPPGLPARPPQYPGATLIVSSREPAPTGTSEPTPDASGRIAQPMLYLIVLDTSDSRDRVYSYYENALEKDPWQIANTFSTQDLDTLQFSNGSDGDISGVVSIAGGGRDNRTSVLISLQDAGAFREKLPPFKLAPSVPVPKLFPSDVPLYKGATFTGSAFVREPGDESFLVIFLTKDSKETVTSFYRSAFQKLGWVIQAGAPLGVEERFNFQDAVADVHGDLLANAFARDSTYTEVRLQVHQKPSRPPAATTTPPATAASTSQPTPVSTPQPTAG